MLSQGEQPPAFIRATVVDTSGTDRSQGRPETGGRMEIALSNGRRVTVGPDVDVEALRRVLAVVDET